MKPFTYRNFQINPVHNYKDGRGDFEYYSLSNCDEGGRCYRKTIEEVKTEIDNQIQYENQD